MTPSIPGDELESLRAAWRSLDARLDRQQALNHQLLTESRVHGAKRRLWTIVAAQVVQLVIGVGATVLFARLWMTHAADPVVLACGLALHAWAVLLACSAVVELLLVTRINYAQPVLVIQRHVALLRRWRTRVSPWLGIAFWVLWPLLMLLGMRIAGFTPDNAFIATNLALGLAGLGATWGFIRWTRSPGRRHLGDAIDRDHAGRGLTQAQAMLDEIDAFRNDPR